ncbi:hypothetical protein SAMN05421837_11879 [Amycolatopsis pretoriensis]|uniref:Uncharacterized protein n=1 Tax=Amycolatopsis pretoriensis TaxID=218821 RepID=A0A1H5RKA0_9PSEU|nr:hypothetical protein [Amycolatopsis pretoriensis]SEF38128.1 hypothetical protein SAMN05421837_11879 [Amycolatopsis pretoriensis]
MDFLFTLLLCAPYPAIGVHTARSVLREPRTRRTVTRSGSRRLAIRTWLYAATLVLLWPAVEVLPPLARWTKSGVSRLRQRPAPTEPST